MRLGVLLWLFPLLCAPFTLLRCTNASTVVQLVDAVVPDLLPTFSSEAFTPKYVAALQKTKTQDVGLGGVLPMKDKYGRSYSCIIPDATSYDKQGQRLSPLKDDEQTTEEDPSQLLSALDSICLYRIEDWWTYELCYKKHVRQFHKDAENVISEYDLGQYDEARSNLNTILDNGTLSGASSKYVRQVYAGGEACDITGQHRETEVHFVCSEEGKEGIKSIREHATCRYTLVFATPRLCKHPGFQIPKQPVQTIVCSRPGGSQQAESTAPAQSLEGAREAEGEVPVAGSGVVTVEGGMKRNAPVTQDEGALEGVVDLKQALQAGGLNLSAYEAASGSSARGVDRDADESQGQSWQERHVDGEDEGMEDSSTIAPAVFGAVGPPSAAGSRAAQREVYYEDDDEHDEADEEADSEPPEEDDYNGELDFSRTGMHAEL